MAFKGATTSELPGLRPLDPARGPKAGPWTSPVKTLRSFRSLRSVLSVTRRLTRNLPPYGFLATPLVLTLLGNPSGKRLCRYSRSESI